MTQFKLEVVVIPVLDVDRAKQFYESLGWRLDADFSTGDDFRVIQVTPTGSPASIIFGTGVRTTTHTALYAVAPDSPLLGAQIVGVDLANGVGEATADAAGGAVGRNSWRSRPRPSW